jgi:serine/threonine protein kinase
MNRMPRAIARQMPASHSIPRSSEIECLKVQAMLQSGYEVEIAVEECRLIAQHVEACGECRALLDVICPESRGSVPKSGVDWSTSLGDFVTSQSTTLAGRLEQEVIQRLCWQRAHGTIGRPLVTDSWTEPFSEQIGSEVGVGDALDSLVGQLAPGRILVGVSSRFRIKRGMGFGDFTETYEAEQLNDGGGPGEPAVIKIPRVVSEMSDDEAMKRLRLLKSLIEVHADELRSPSPLHEVARVLDRGEYVHRLRTQSTTSTFVASEYIPGSDLEKYMSAEHGGRDACFTGLKKAADFSHWARMLTMALREIHNKLIVHGDINPHNILVNKGRPVFIDVGQSLFAEVMKGVEEFSAYFYRAPEGVTTPSSDLFSLGGVLYFLATGKNPIGLSSFADNEALKRQVALKVKNANRELYQDDAGVVDVIAMCLRKTGRVQHASHLLRDIDTFWPEAPPTSIRTELEAVRDEAAILDCDGNSLYRSIAGVQTRALHRVMTDMTRGVFDISGSSNDIRSAAYALIGALGDGDEFFGLSLPVFWAPENIGVNGRFLSMTRNAAARGARIRRVFLLEEALGDKHLQQIVAAQLNAVADVDQSARSNYAVRYVVMSAGTRRQLVAAGKHFGLLVKAGDQISMFPVYSESDLLVTLRFRSGTRQVEGLRETFDSVWSYARPLVDLRLPPAMAGTDGSEKAAG